MKHLFPFALAILVCASSAAQSPHIPTAEEVERQRSGVTADRDDIREYQAHSTQTFMGRLRGAARWVKDKLARLHITPARLAMGLGILGVLYTWGRNKRHVKWAVLTVTSWLLLLFGGAAMIFRWPYMN